ncbi:hypothetical protein ACHAPA_009636 [Fusarium lateritium]
MKPLVLNTSLRTVKVEDLDRPAPSAGEILVRVHAIALNPVDELYVTSPIAGQADAHAFAKEFYKFLSEPLPSGRAQLEPNPVRLVPGGLNKVIPDGFALLGSGSVSERANLARDEEYMCPISAEKLVYTIN